MQETCRDSGSIPGLGRSPAEGNGYPLQHSCLENPTHRGTWCATVHGVTKSGAWQYGLYILHSSKSNYSFTSTNYCWLAHIYKQTHTHTHTHNHKTVTNHPVWEPDSSIVRLRLVIFDIQIAMREITKKWIADAWLSLLPAYKTIILQHLFHFLNLDPVNCMH